MNKTVKKYKLSELAKDINAAANEVIECLSVLGGEPKKSGAFLTPQEVGYVMEYFTQKNQVDSFEAYYANNVKPEPAKEEKKDVVDQIIEKEELADDSELVAVISAAIAAYEADNGSASSDGFVVRSIRKVNKSKWQNA